MGLNLSTLSKNKKLIFSIVCDLIGMLSYIIPFIDVFWAPFSVWLMFQLYKGNVAKVGGLISFVEEAIPGMDFIPSFTLTWLYVYVFKKD